MLCYNVCYDMLSNMKLHLIVCVMLYYVTLHYVILFCNILFSCSYFRMVRSMNVYYWIHIYTCIYGLLINILRSGLGLGYVIEQPRRRASFVGRWLVLLLNPMCLDAHHDACCIMICDIMICSVILYHAI